MHHIGPRRRLLGALAVTVAAALAITSCASSDNGGAASSGATTAQQSATQSDTGTADQPAPSAAGDTTTLTIATNGISGGKNALEADWIQNYAIPEFTKWSGS